MPRLMIPIDSLEDTVSRPVVLDIARQIATMTRLPPGIKFQFPGDEERVAITGSTINKDNDEHNNFGHEARIDLDVTETIEEDAVLTRAIFCPEHIPVFIDQLLGINVRPVYAHTTVELSFSARFPDRNSAIRWRSEMQNKVSMMRDTPLHKASYSYIIPVPIIHLLQEIHRLRENQAGYGQDWEEYFNLAKTPHVTEVTNVGGKHVRPAVRETQQRIIGQFDFNTEPERGNKEGEADTWVINFTYKFRYDKPTAMVIEYPLVVHNQLLDEDYRPSRIDAPTPQLIDKPRQFSNSLDYIHNFEADRDSERWKSHQKGIGLPDFDEFIPQQIVTGTYRMVTWLVGLSEEDRVDLINIKDLPGTDGLHPTLHEFMLESELPFMTQPHRSVFQLQVYEDNLMLTYKHYRLTPEANLVATENLDLRKTYHVRLGVYWDWRELDDKAKDRLRSRPDVMQLLLDELFPNYKNYYDTDWCLVGPGWMARKCFDKLLDNLFGDRELNDHLRRNGVMRTRQTLFIHAANINDPEEPKEDFYHFPN